MDNELDEIYDKVAEFSEIFEDVIKDKSCMGNNPFIDNVSKYIGNYIPEFEIVFKYHLLFETILAILSSVGSPGKTLLERFNSIYTSRPAKPSPLANMEEIRKIRPALVIEILNKIVASPENSDIKLFSTEPPESPNAVPPEIPTKILSFIVNILETTSKYNDGAELIEIYDACFPKQTETEQSGGDGDETMPNPFGKLANTVATAANTPVGKLANTVASTVTNDPTKALSTMSSVATATNPMNAIQNTLTSAAMANPVTALKTLPTIAAAKNQMDALSNTASEAANNSVGTLTKMASSNNLLGTVANTAAAAQKSIAPIANTAVEAAKATTEAAQKSIAPLANTAVEAAKATTAAAKKSFSEIAKSATSAAKNQVGTMKNMAESKIPGISTMSTETGKNAVGEFANTMANNSLGALSSAAMGSSSEDIANTLLDDMEPTQPNDSSTTETNTAENPADTEKTCFINTKRDLKLKQTLLKDNMLKFNIKKEVNRAITDEIDKISQLVLNEKTLNNVLLKSKNPEDKPKIQTIKSIKNKLLHNHVFIVKKDKPEYVELYTKSFTIQILQNIKLYLINIAKTIVNTSKEHSAYGLPVLLLTLLQDNGIKGFLLTIERSKQYAIYIKELQTYKRIQDIPKLELNAIACLTYVYYNIASNPKIKSSSVIDLQRTHTYMQKLNNGLIQKYFPGRSDTDMATNRLVKGGTPELGSMANLPGVGSMANLPGVGSMTDMTSAMSGLANIDSPALANHVVKQKVSSYLDPQNRYVETVVKDYVGSVISSVKKKVYTYDLYKYVKTRMNTDADELRITLLFCVLEMFKENSFRLFLNKLLQENDILKQPGDATPPPPPQANPDDSKLIANDVIMNLFLQKLTDDLNNPENKFSEEVTSKYTNLITGISTPKDTENEIAKALRINIKKTGGGTRWNFRLRTIKAYNRPTKHTFKKIQHTPKKRRPRKRNTVRVGEHRSEART